jgi:outer membrane cobalamin receptor
VAAVVAAWSTRPCHAGPGEGRKEPPLDITNLSISELLDVNITTASRTTERALEAPGTIYVISRNDIRVRGYSTLADVLRDLPGMEITEHYYSEQGTLIPVRGVVGNNKIVLLINGARVNPPGGEELIVRGDISVRYAEQIEVIYGPGSTLYGQDAISAIINIRTRKPDDDTKIELLGGAGQYRSLEGFASFGAKFRQDTDLPLTFTAFVAGSRSTLSNLKEEFPEWWKRYEPLVVPIGRNRAIRGDWAYNAMGRLESKDSSIQVWYRESKRSSSEGSGEGGATNPVLYWVDEAKWWDREVVVEGQRAVKVTNRSTLTTILTYNRYQISPKSRYVFPDGKGGLFFDDWKYGTGSGGWLEEKLDVDLGEDTRFMAGLVAANFDIVPKVSVPGGADPDIPLVPQAGFLTYYTEANNPASRVDIMRTGDFHYQQYGGYAEGSHRFNDTIRAIFGVRVDSNTRFSEIPVSPRASLILSAFEKRLVLKYNFARAYVWPAPYFVSNVFDNGSQLSAGNNDLKPEQATSNELNVTWQSGGLLLTASAYLNRQSNLLITSQSEVPETVINPMVFVNPDGTGPRRLTHNINLGSSTAMGADIFARYSGSTISGWASYSFVDFERVLSGRHSGLDQISRHNVRAGITVNLRSNLAVTPSLVFRSTPENLPSTYDNPGVDLHNPWELNLAAIYSPWSLMDVFLTARNLTDRHYAVRGVSGPALQEPLTVMGGLRLRY